MRARSPRRPGTLLLTVTALLLSACASDGADQPPGGAAGDDRLAGEVIVFAAASLSEAFAALGTAFTDAHPGAEVVLNVAGSQVLANQIREGARADVFASADVTQMDAVVDVGAAAGDPAIFAGNSLVVAVEPGNPLGIDSLADLAAPELIVVLPAEEVPAGAYSRTMLDAAGVAVTPASLERDVRAALAKVVLGEADAAIVYASDATADGADTVAIPEGGDVEVAYPIVTLRDAPNPDAAAAFTAFVQSRTGQDVLRVYGFEAP